MPDRMDIKDVLTLFSNILMTDPSNKLYMHSAESFWYLVSHVEKMSAINKNLLKDLNGWRNFEQIVHYFMVITVAADGLAPLGARTSADTVMTKCRACMYTDPYGSWYIMVSRFRALTT